MTENEDFGSLGLSPEMLAAVEAKGFERPTPIQKLTIPRLLEGRNDIIAQSQTGTGKTAAYGLPILQVLERGAGGVQAIVLVPTRELALQVTEELVSYNRERKLSVAAIYGGASMSEQLRRLAKGADIVVGTPGRVLDHIRRRTLDLSCIRYLVLDEADEMLNMGFIEDVEEIMSHTPEERRVLLFSATMPRRIVNLSQTYMHDAELLRVESAQLTADLTDQIYFEVREADKFDALTRIIDITPEFYGIVFSCTKVGTDELVNRLLERGYAAEGLHGDVSQAQREKVLRRFRNRQVNILVATDVAARGIDINNLSHVINYSLPQDSESYVHRIGRTGRAGNQGTAITFISSSEMRQFGFLRRDIKADIRRQDLPTPQDIVAVKRQRIKEELDEIVAGGDWTDYNDVADELLDAYTPEVALAALLRLAFRSELDESAYPEIRSFSVDRRGKARLFIAVGREDGYDVRKLVALLKRECGLRDKHIDDVKLGDSYSFVSVPFEDAEQVVHRLNRLRRGKRPLAEIAKPAGTSDEGRSKQRGRAPVAAKHAGAAEAPGEGRFADAVEQATDRTQKKVRGGDGRTTSGFTERPGRTVAAGGRKSAVVRDGRQGGKGKPRRAPQRDGGGNGVQGFPESEGSGGFDWSFFEKDGNRWERPAKGRKRK
ncbi:MAG TPA: DEAD/DEAH box helicase [Candidatus Tidjanibacter gallistercoris]|nr:DEAD/DEAH box helicase [Candidatus Tidjanibacter gallistercoris]